MATWLKHIERVVVSNYRHKQFIQEAVATTKAWYNQGMH